MERKLQIFISSTYTDLIEERQAAVEAILNAGHIPAGMELFKAGDQTQQEIIEEWIKESDVYLLILGARYGSINTVSDTSYTEWEYNLAGELEIPRFSLVLSEDYINNKVDQGLLKATEIETKMEKHISFKSNVESHLVEYINHIDGIKGAILGSVNNIIKKNSNLKGWIRYADEYDEKKYYDLIQENQELKKQLLDDKIRLREETRDLKQGDDSLNIKVAYEIHEKIIKISEQTKKPYHRYLFKENTYTEVEISINELLEELLPYLVQYDKKGISKYNIEDKIKSCILKKADVFEHHKHYSEYKVYSEDKEQYKTAFTIPELDKIITQFILLELISFSKGNVCITDYGIEEVQRLFAYRK